MIQRCRHLDSSSPDNTSFKRTIEGATTIDLLGSVSLASEGERIELRSGKIRSMVASLALAPGRTVYHNELLDELWSREILKNPRNALQAHATRIRRLLKQCTNGSDRVELRAVYNGYILDVPRESIDCHRFLDLSTRGSEELPLNAARAMKFLQDSLALWRGPALLNTQAGERCRSAAAYLEERRSAACENLVIARLLLGDNSEAAAELHRLMTVSPVRERLCGLLMLTFYRTGRQSEALQLFHRTRERLNEELGVEPSKTLLHLYEDILVQDSMLDSSEAVLRAGLRVRHPA